MAQVVGDRFAKNILLAGYRQNGPRTRRSFGGLTSITRSLATSAMINVGVCFSGHRFFEPVNLGGIDGRLIGTASKTGRSGQNSFCLEGLDALGGPLLGRCWACGFLLSGD